MSTWEQEQKKEQQRINEVVKKVEREARRLQGSMGAAGKDIVGIRRNFWEDVTVNMENSDEMAETFASIKQQSELLSEQERRHTHSGKQLDLLGRLTNSPYFGRINFHENGMPETEQIYIGIGSFYDEEKEDFLIYDWRAPISSVYYDYSIGPAHYEAPAEEVSGTLLLKRQFMIRHGKLMGMFDTGETIGDEILQEVLGKQADSQMKSIVATIQSEQNLIIRNEKSQLLIVQGAAGSGKTSAALQRVAYLLYRNRDRMNAENILLFSPNPLFNSYVANVLPELGEDNMQQTTFQQYLLAMVGETPEIEEQFSQLEFVLTEMDHRQYSTRLSSIRYKSSLSFLTLIDKYLDVLKTKGLVFRNIKLRGEIIVRAEEISEYFYQLNQSLPIPNRLLLVSQWLVKSLRKRERAERKADWVEEEIQYLDKEDYLRSYRIANKKIKDDEDSFDEGDLEQKILSEYIVKKRFKPLYKKVKAFAFLDAFAVYRRIFKQKADHEQPEDWSAICLLTLKQAKVGKLLYEDATPFLYLKEQLEGFRRNTQIRHVFIDEAQDYSPFQFAFLKKLFPYSKLTILGDFNQTIFAHGNDDGLDMLLSLYDPAVTEKIVLNRSYRSTKEIVEFTKAMLEDGEDIQPFNRLGHQPVLWSDLSQAEHTDVIIQIINSLQENGHDTIAVICKTAAETERAYRALKEKIQIRRIGTGKAVFGEGIIVVPTYLAKGIEFDAVIIYDASSKQYGYESERKLFYTACTRAMHELYICSCGEVTPFIKNIPADLYSTKNEKNNGS